VEHTGKIAEIVYDCFGDFAGFLLETCDGCLSFPACERGIEEVVRRACKDRSKVTIVTRCDPGGSLLRIVVHCC
jgi:hypothetical protein